MSSEIETSTFDLVAQCINKLHYRVPQDKLLYIDVTYHSSHFFNYILQPLAIS
jgi:hypothetical protein